MRKCAHPTLRVESIKIAQRCPSCRRFVLKDGRSFLRVPRAVAEARNLADTNKPDTGESPELPAGRRVGSEYL